MDLYTKPSLYAPLLNEGLDPDGWVMPTDQQIEASREKYGGRILMESILQRADAINQMGRVYPHAILKREFDIYEQFVGDRSAHGECNHPSESVVDLERTVLIITKQWWKQDQRTGCQEWWGEFEVLTNPLAMVVQHHIMDKVKFGISSRGLGSVEYNERQKADVVQDDFVIIAFDIVSHPSTHHAVPHIKPIMVKVDPFNPSIAEHKVYDRYQNNRLQMLAERSNRSRSNMSELFLG